MVKRKINRFRFSSTGRILSCPASKHAPLIDINVSGADSLFGTTIHDFLFEALLYKKKDVKDLPLSAKKYGIEVTDDLYMIAWAGLDCLAFILERMEPIMAEEKLTWNVSGFRGTGHPDIICEMHNYRQLVIADWKTGTPKRSHWEQLKMYAVAARKKYGYEPGTIKLMTIYLRSPKDEMIVIQDFTVAEQDAFIILIADTLKNRNYYGPSPEACQYCPHRGDCVARNTELKKTTSWLTDDPSKEMTVQFMVDNFEKVKYIEAECKKYISSLKSRLQQDGSIRSQDGTIFSMEDKEGEVFKSKETLEWLFSTQHCESDIPLYFAILESAISATLSKKNMREVAKKIDMKYGDMVEKMKTAGCLERKITQTLKKEVDSE